MTTAYELLGQAISLEVLARLEAGLGYLRVPEMAKPLPIDRVIQSVAAVDSTVRVAVFSLDHPENPAGLRLTFEVAEAVRWRDENQSPPLLIFGDLERNRAAGLQRVPIVDVQAVRSRLFHVLSQDTAERSQSQYLTSLLTALSTSPDVAVDLAAEYCAAVVQTTNDVPESARRELWRLGLLPDLAAGEITRTRLHENAEIVAEIRGAEPAILQRLIVALADGGSGSYEAIRAYAQSGNRTHLKELDLTQVKVALRRVRSTGGAIGSGDEGEGEDEDGPSFLERVRDGALSRADVEEQTVRQAIGDDDSGDGLRINGETFDWTFVDLEPLLGRLAPTPEESLIENEDVEDEAERQVGEFLEMAGGYADTAGSISDHTAGTEASVRWHDFETITSQLRLLEGEVTAALEVGLPSAMVERIVKHRRQLAPHLASIPHEGVKLFLVSSELREVARALLNDWVELWDSLRNLQAALPIELRSDVPRVADALTLADLSVVRSDSATDVMVLPLHPVVLEPRVRAAELFAASTEVDDEFFDVVVGSLDPGTPAISFAFEGNSVGVTFAGFRGSLPFYSSARQSGTSAETVGVLRKVFDRFVSAHPFSELCFSVALIHPSADVAAAILEILARGSFTAHRSNLLVLAPAESIEDVERELLRVREKLTVSDSGIHHVEEEVIACDLAEAPTALATGGRSPHVTVLFNAADETEMTGSAALESPLLGTVLTHWQFHADLVSHQPVIRPTASGSLGLLAYKQEAVSNSRTVEVQRSPLLPSQLEDLVGDIGTQSAWLVLAENATVLAAPPELGEAGPLLGRVASGSTTAYVYGRSRNLLVEPVLRYLQRNAWLDPEPDELVAFLARTLRQALPEGLLGFFRGGGLLQQEAVLERLGVAAVLADLQRQYSDSEHLVVSLDSGVAREWLGRRSGTRRRADLLHLARTSSGWHVTAIESKARTGQVSWSGSTVPGFVTEAQEQVEEMVRLLRQVFGRDEDLDGFAESRKEILKRQVFLDALEQWEHLRAGDWDAYRNRVRSLNELFEGPAVEVTGKIFVVSADSEELSAEVEVGDPPIPVQVLGHSWLQGVLHQGNIGPILDLDLLDLVSAEAAPAVVDRTLIERADRTEEPVEVASLEPTLRDRDVRDESHRPEDGAQGHDRVQDRSIDREDVAGQVYSALLARGAPVKSLNSRDLVIGPSFIRVPFEVPTGSRLATLQSQETDLARDLGVSAVRIDNLPGRRGFAVVELPRENREIADITTVQRVDNVVGISLALGTTVDFSTYRVSVAELPHLLVAGMTGAGKSVFLRSLLWQLTHLYSPDEVELVMIDAKGMNDYRDLGRAPHFHEQDDFHVGALGALERIASLVEQRLAKRIETFNAFAEVALNNDPPIQISNLTDMLVASNATGSPSPLRPLVVFIDEFAELVLTTSDRKRFETLITSFVQRARAVGAHLVAATQRPSVDVVSGVMKGNFSRLALRVASGVDSRVILDASGAETLLPHGDMLYKSPTEGLVRLQGFSALGPYGNPVSTR